MMMNPDVLPFTNPTDLWLEIPESEETKIWQQTQAFSTSNRRWIAYLNRLSLNAFLPWLQAEHAPNAAPFPNLAALPSIWEVVNGVGISMGTKRLVLIPTEAVDLSELRVPQEWVDIPKWTADYYVAVQVLQEEGCIRIWGYTTHALLKSMGSYDASDRAYCLNGEDLISNINILWMASQVCPEEATRGEEAAPLPELAIAQAENLIQRLGNPRLILPRLAVPFPTWGALLEHGGWRQRLYEKRQGQQQQWSITQWLQTGVSDFAQKFGWVSVELQPLPGSRNPAQTYTLPTLVRKVTISGKQYELRVQPKGNIEDRVWRFELQNVNKDEMIPAGFKLRLLTADLQEFAGNQVQAKSPEAQLDMEVPLSHPGEGLVWEIEPTPEDFDHEILIF